MKPLLNFLRATLVGGILFLVPVIVLGMVIGKAVHMAHVVADPLAEHLPVTSVIGLKTPMLLAIFLLVLFSFAAGMFARTALARRANSWLEESVLANVPGYSVIKLMGEGMLGVENEKAQPVVFVRFDDAWQIGFLAERLTDGYVAVHLPDADSPHSGGIFIMSEDRVVVTKISPAAALKTLRMFGHGSRALLQDHLAALRTIGKNDRLP